jgi:hypothetical protein
MLMAIYSAQKVKDDRKKLVETTRALCTPNRSRWAFLESFLELSYAIMMSRTLAPLYQYSKSLAREVADKSKVNVTHEKALDVLDNLFGFLKRTPCLLQAMAITFLRATSIPLPQQRCTLLIMLVDLSSRGI